MNTDPRVSPSLGRGAHPIPAITSTNGSSVPVGQLARGASVSRAFSTRTAAALEGQRIKTPCQPGTAGNPPPQTSPAVSSPQPGLFQGSEV